ncbi:MAG: beta-ketoacyl-ACP synthase II [Paludibacteraceae bacterium]|nr:beta-ketoacyl-ACP synthase II [Paludibacteraceae bacterium]
MKLKRVVITGLGALTPLGNDVDSTWSALIEGQSGAAPITAFDCSKFKTQFACEVKGWDVSSVIPDVKEQRKLERYHQLSVCSTAEAMRDAGFNREKEDSTRMGVVWGSGMGGLINLEQGFGDFITGDGTPRFSPFYIPKALVSMGAGWLSLFFDLKGPSLTITTACSSASHAIAQAFDYIRLGRADIMVTGGADANITYSGVGGFNSLHAISTRNDSPQTASRPFSKSRDGFVLGEGSVTLILEEYEHAKARGAKIYGEIVGAAINSDAYHMTAPDPEGMGAARVMKMALEDAAIQPADVDYINTHGTSTPLGDIAELKAICNVFKEHVYQMNLDSTKSMTGHMIGAAGAMEALACVLALKNGIVPPTINHADDDEDENIDYRINFTFNKAQKRDMTYAISNTFGFGGHNACLVFKKFSND